MADVEKPAPDVTQPRAQTPSKNRKQGMSSITPKKIPLHEVYALPAPIRTFPLPSFYPNNPLSLFHVLWAWTSQVLSPPPAEPAVIHLGHWSPETRSVHVRDAKSIRALWEQGFFGKGHYSRSEPNWLKREQSRQGQGEKKVSELVTVERREERKMMKWDRARKEQEAIQRTLLLEAWVAPVGPKELLALPNSLQDPKLSSSSELRNGHGSRQNPDPVVPHTPIQTARNEMCASIPVPPSGEPSVNGDQSGKAETAPFPSLNGDHPVSPRVTKSARTLDSAPSTLKRRKSVRFSPDVESTTFQSRDPPSPHVGSPVSGKMPNGEIANGSPPSPRPLDTVPTQVLPSSTTAENPASPPDLVDREHLQLSPEEAFYLVYALGALSVVDPATGKTLTARELFHLFCQLSYFPPGTGTLRPDDPFLIQYAVYHHFRSLGWVPRSGIKFGVDWLLYIGGPVFSHAEFTVTVLPAYTHPYWKSQGHQHPKRSWHWLHSINRVQSHALKTMMLVYVDIPPPTETSDPSTLLRGYKIREFYMKRWLSNRSR
ncbi:hypothetical protein O1611_g9568 [Lasiodiplodia mahajangana]|uniref:Uncharacterized protein n=1 Tax=Lasiodiplodia mahajangana TaxID=1108764 RepID=A0ACC2J804_9PEZI|nr:hypothetical protein O1611_g9568 [Lasiodiplodia mahajangana]